MANLPREDDLNSARPTVSFDRNEANLGDGFRRLAPRGLNTVRESYQLTYCTMPNNEALSLVNLLKASLGVTPFDWTPPGESTSRQWTVESVEHPTSGQINKTVSITLQEFF